MKYNHERSKLKLWIIYTFRTFRYLWWKSIRKECNDILDEIMKVEYAYLIWPSNMTALNIIGKICISPILWILALAYNVFVFTCYEVLIRTFVFVISVPCIWIFIIIRMIFIKSSIKDIHNKLEKSSGW